MSVKNLLAACLAASAVVSGACTGATTPTQVPPPVPAPPDPPKITCPAAQTAQSIDGLQTTVGFSAPVVANGQLPVTTTCTPPAGSAFSIGQKTVTCTATDALQRTDSCSFVVTVDAPPKLSTTSFLAFGDSITAGEDGFNSTAPTLSQMSARFHPSALFPIPQRYPSVLFQLLLLRYKTQSPTLDNQGSPGEAASDRDALRRFTSLTATRRYTVVLIMEGSNDLYDRDSRIFPAAWDGLRSMVRDAKSRGLRPYLATIPPMNPAACSPVCRGLPWSLVSGYNDGVRALASSEGATLVDVYQAFNGNFALIGPDGLHPSPEGYAKIADVFFEAIKQTLETPATPITLSLRRTTAAR